MQDWIPGIKCSVCWSRDAWLHKADLRALARHSCAQASPVSPPIVFENMATWTTGRRVTEYEGVHGRGVQRQLCVVK